LRPTQPTRISRHNGKRHKAAAVNKAKTLGSVFLLGLTRAVSVTAEVYQYAVPAKNADGQ